MASVIREYEEQLAALERQNKKRLMMATPDFHRAKVAAESVRFESDTIPDFLRQNPTESSPGLGWWPPKLCLRRQNLCASSAAIDFETAFTTPRASPEPDHQWPYKYRRAAPPVNEVERNSNCQFCRYLENTVGTTSENGDYILVFHNEGRGHYDNHDEVSIKVFPSSARSPGLESFQEMRASSNTIVCHRNRPVIKAWRPRIVSPDFDASLAQSWLDTCKHTHPLCAVEDRRKIPTTRLIDCFTRKLVSVGPDTDPRPSFVALSYVWGAAKDKAPSSITDKKDLPLTIEDAITVTKDLGFKYLWVDQYCIDQGDKVDKARQIAQMDLIYICADLTIIAAAGDSRQYGLPGVSTCRRDVLEPFVLDDYLTFGIHPREDSQYWKKGSWHTRGWTYQEALLSRRRLIFSDTAMYYECRVFADAALQSELFGGVECSGYNHNESRAKVYERDGFSFEPVLRSNTILSRLWYAARLGVARNYEHKCLLESFLTYAGQVTQYTTRTLSFASDGLNAFRGAANALQHYEHPVFNIGGIPFVAPGKTEVDDSLVVNSFLRGLAWRSTGGDQALHQQLPSWCWANVRVWNVTWIWDHDQQEYVRILAKATYHAHDVHIEYAGVRRKLTPLSRFDGDPTAMSFKSRTLNSSFHSEYLDFFDRGSLATGHVYRDGGHSEVDIEVYVDGASTDQQNVDTGGARHGRSSQTACVTRIFDDQLHMDMESGKCGLVLLRFDDEDATALLVEWLGGEQNQHQKLARRVGICKFNHHGEKSFLDCFSSDTDLKLE